MSGASTVQIAAMLAEHAADVLAIYQAGIDEGQATFETVAPTWEAFDAAKLHLFDLQTGLALAWRKDHGTSPLSVHGAAGH